MSASGCMSARTGDARGDVPRCSICCDVLGAEGGPVTLPCGHNGCFFCLREVQAFKPECPLCRQPFPADYPLHPNPVLKQLVTTAHFNSGGVDEDGWEAVPTRAHAVKMYAQELDGQLQSQTPRRRSLEESRRSFSEPPASRAAQDVVRDAAAQHMNAGPGSLAILSGSYHNRRAEPKHSYESILSWVPPQWMPDSCAPECKGCCKPFKPLVRMRHHCRLCGLIFCHGCSSQRVLLPPKFAFKEPERVCDRCYDVLKPADLQNALAGHFSKAAQLPIHDVTDWTSMRAWLNNPLTSSLEQDIFKSTTILEHFLSSSRFHVERAIPSALLQQAAGYAILSVVKVGMGWSAAVGTGLVVARREDGSWSPPSAIGLSSFGWGIQAGGELTDLLLVLSSPETVKAFCGDVHLGLTGNVNVTVGPVGRDASASMCMGRKGYAMVYSYSCSRGAFMGMSIDGTVTHTRANANLAFYGRPLTAKDLLLAGSVDAPPAARSLYSALDTMINSFAYSDLQRNAQPSMHSWMGTSGSAQLHPVAEDHESDAPTQKGGASTSNPSAGLDFGASSTVLVPSAGAVSSENACGTLTDTGLPERPETQAGGHVEPPQASLLGASQMSAASEAPSVVQNTSASVISQAGQSEDEGYSLYELFD